MARLIYSAITSLDGYVNDASGRFDWAAPDEQVHAFVNELERPIGTYLYGRRMFEVMRYWQGAPTDSSASAVEADYARIWQAADKIVYSTTLPDSELAESSKTRLERAFDPAAIRALKAASTGDISVGGPGLAAHALAAGLVDEIHLLLNPVIVGAGTAALPGGLFLRLELLDSTRFGNGVLHARYAISASSGADDHPK